MHAVAVCAIRAAHISASRRSCCVIAGIRCPSLQRQFHRSAISYRIPDDSRPAEQNSADPTVGNETKQSEDVQPPDEAVDSPRTTEGDSAPLITRTKSGKSTSGRVRGTRQRQPEGLPPVFMPDWFWDKNVKLVGGPASGGTLALFGETSVSDDIEDRKVVSAELAGQLKEILDADLLGTSDAKYSLHVDVYREIMAAVRAGLTLRPPKSAATSPISRPVTVLQCPKDGGTYYLDSVVDTIATKLDADLVRLDAIDIAQVVSSYIDDNIAWHLNRSKRTAMLGYEAHKVAGRLQEYDKENEETADEGESAGEEDEKESWLPKFQAFSLSKAFQQSKQRAPQGPRFWRDIGLGKPGESNAAQAFSMLEVVGVRGDHSPILSSGSTEQWNDLKIGTVLEALISAADSKRSSSSTEARNTGDEAHTANFKDLIIQVRDYGDLKSTTMGPALIARLRDAVDKRWQEGRNIILVGTSCAEEDDPAITRPEIQQIQFDVSEGEQRTIFVPPDRREEQTLAFEADEKALIRSVNIRHIEDMVKKLAEGQELLHTVDIDKDIDSASTYSAGLEDAVWSHARVHRVSTTMLGLNPAVTLIDGLVFSKALDMLTSSDEAKFKWGARELKEGAAEVEDVINDLNDTTLATKRAQDKLKQVRKTCTSHEKKLLSGVILPSDIKTTFADIRAPKETIEALKTLTSLSLIRPEAFTYGVLATDRIPGLLLYGPPGTGKTLLAKAVAKESGAIVLEISGAEVNDMYVGEGEKNVKAVFSLAKKLSPCVVFIDEADAIFASRGEAKRSGTHRELINQFLREWDGMTDMSAFIMVATNRPFDLDEAALRRLPRRLLVDLPMEQDREAILKIHLKNELLNESVSIPTLAKDTPFYSGSDLKNLSVAAALACIREENETAAKHSGEEPYVYPEKRILTKKHFDKALEEISASISEDMTTLTAIRKFDEKYGDRKGRRKKAAALGFGGARETEKDSEAARVRKMEAVEV